MADEKAKAAKPAKGQPQGGQGKGGQQVGEASSIFDPEPIQQGVLCPGGQVIPGFTLVRGIKPRELSQQTKPEGLNLDRVAFPGGAGRVVRVHPGEMARTPDQS